VNALQLRRFTLNVVADFPLLLKKTITLFFWAILWGLGATHAVHSRLIGKLSVDFPLVMIELFSLGAEAEEL